LETYYLLCAAAVVVVCVLIIGGCSAASRARQSFAQGDPFTAVQLYDEALAQKPNDADLRADAEVARDQAGTITAREAESALAMKQFSEALSLARRAAQYDAAYVDLEPRVRSAWSHDLVAKANAALAAANYQSAHRLIAQADELTPGRADIATLKATIHTTEANDLVAAAHALASTGEFDQAVALANRAAQLMPSDATVAALPGAIVLQQREAQFDLQAIKAEAHLREGKLAALDRVLESMTSLGVREDRLASFIAQRDLAVADIDRELASARTARESGDFPTALRHYAAAELIGSDIEAIRLERAACESDRQAASLFAHGEEALAAGRFEQAIDFFKQSFDLKADEAVQRKLSSARAGKHRQRFDAALAANDLASAIAALDQVQRFEPMQDYGETRTNLEGQLVIDSANHASQLFTAGQTEQALAVLETALAVVADKSLANMHGDMTAELLLEQAVRAEQAGRFAEARDLYLEALAAGGDRAAISPRIDSTTELANLQRSLQEANLEINSLLSAIDEREYQANALRAQLFNAEHVIHDYQSHQASLECALADLRRDNHHLHDVNAALEREQRSLQREIQQLRESVRHHSTGGSSRPSGQNGRRP